MDANSDERSEDKVLEDCQPLVAAIIKLQRTEELAVAAAGAMALGLARVVEGGNPPMLTLRRSMNESIDIEHVDPSLMQTIEQQRNHFRLANQRRRHYAWQIIAVTAMYSKLSKTMLKQLPPDSRVADLNKGQQMFYSLHVIEPLTSIQILCPIDLAKRSYAPTWMFEVYTSGNELQTVPVPKGADFECPVCNEPFNNTTSLEGVLLPMPPDNAIAICRKCTTLVYTSGGRLLQVTPAALEHIDSAIRAKMFAAQAVIRKHKAEQGEWFMDDNATRTEAGR